MMAKRFFYVAAGILFLFVAYSIGPHRADAQSPDSSFVELITDGVHLYAMTSNGDVYLSPDVDAGGLPDWRYWGNIRGGAVNVEGKSWSAIKDGYRKQRVE